MTVPGEQIQRLRDALMGAFPDGRSLTAMVLFELGENLNVITEAGNLNDRAFELIRWCDARGRLDELVRGAKAQNPGNDALGRLFDAWPFTPAQGLADPTRLAKGQRVGEKNAYTIEALIGCGAMGVVYRVLDANDRPRALKLLLGRAMRDQQVLARIKREATIGGRFGDDVREHVVDVLDVGLDRSLGDGGCAYLAMELLRGETLAERVEARGRLTPEAVIALAEPLASVLQEASRADLRVVHCDLKPENLFFARQPGGGEALKVLDFGVAQVMRERTLGQAFRFTGTPLFAALEQWQPDAPLTPAADLWAFGLIVFYALTGGYFWASKVLPGLMEEILLSARYPPASVRAKALGVTLPEGFDGWFARCVCAEVSGRFASAEAAVAALRGEVRWPADRAQVLPTLASRGSKRASWVRWPADRARVLPGVEAPRAAARASVPVSCRAATPPEERGEGLDERIARDGPMALPEVAAMLRGVAQWLALHREVSPVRGHLEPSRVRFLAGGEVRVLGLEAASVTDARGGAGATRTLVNGAPAVGYVPPPLRREGRVDDAWALARVAFFALTGEPYVRATNVRDALQEAGKDEAPSARSGRLPEGFDGWFRQCSARVATERFGDVAEAAAAFAGLRMTPSPLPPAFVAPPPAPPPKPPAATAEVPHAPLPPAGFTASVRVAPAERPIVAASAVRAETPSMAKPSRTPWIAAGGVLVVLIALALGLRGGPTPPPAEDTVVDARVDARVEAAVVVPRPEPTCPEGMALIRAGTFRMGSANGVGEEDEQPAHDVTLGAFCIDRTEVSVMEYRACVTAGACSEPNAYASTRGSAYNFCNWGRPGAEDHPVNCVDWTQAKAFCEWSAHPRGAGRLLREAEWEYAARGTAGRLYPWGDTAPNGTLANFCGSECAAYVRSLGHSSGHLGMSGIAGWTDGFGTTAPVPAFESGETPEHVRNLAGNVWDWGGDEYLSDAYAQHTVDGHLRDASSTSQSTKLRVVRGGGWGRSDAAFARAALRNGYNPARRFSDVGVRCARGVR